MMHSETSQQNAFQNSQQQTSPQVAAALQQLAQALQQNQQGGLGQGQFGQGAYGQGGFGQNTSFGQNTPFGQNWGGQRQFTQQEVSNALHQIAPILPQIIAQAQQQNQQNQMQQPMAAFGGGYGYNQRSLSPQDVNEVVRQILPIVPQLLQQQQSYGGGGQGGFGQQGFGWQGQGAYGTTPQQNFGPFGQHQHSHQRQLSPQDVNEIARQLAEVLPLAYGQRM
jgi:hypothetical protein